MAVELLGRHAVLLSNTLYYASILFLVATGLSLIYGVLRLLNLAHAAFLTLGAFLTATLINAAVGGSLGVAEAFVSFLVVLLVVPAVVAALGMALERSLFERLYDLDDTFQLLATFGLLLMLEDAMKFVWGANPVTASAPKDVLGSVSLFGRQYPLYMLFVAFVTALVAAGLYYFFERTRLGKITIAMAEDPETVQASGIDMRSIHLRVFLLGVALAGLGGSLWLPNASVTIGLSLNFVLLAFAVIVIGGLASLKGAIAASLLIGVIRVYGIAYFPEVELAVVFLLMAVVMLIKPTGLFEGVEV